MIARALYSVRWWKWLLGAPSILRMHASGLDRTSRDILEQRWLEAEPDFHGKYPYREDFKMLSVIRACPAQGEISGVDLIRASGLSMGAAYAEMLRLERIGVLASRWVEGPNPRRRMYRRV